MTLFNTRIMHIDKIMTEKVTYSREINISKKQNTYIF